MYNIEVPWWYPVLLFSPFVIATLVAIGYKAGVASVVCPV